MTKPLFTGHICFILPNGNSKCQLEVKQWLEVITFWNCSNSPLRGQCWIYTSFQVEECAKNAPHSKWGDVENTPPSKWRSVRKYACVKI